MRKFDAIRITQTFEDENEVFFDIQCLLFEDVDKAIEVCHQQIALIERGISRGNIPWPKRLPRELPKFDLRFGYVRSSDPPAANARGFGDARPSLLTRLGRAVRAVLGKRDLEREVAGIVAQIIKPGAIVVVGEGLTRQMIRNAIRRAGRQVVKLPPGYGFASWIAKGLLRRPQPGFFLDWLIWDCEKRLTETAGFVFVDPEASRTDIEMVTQGVPSDEAPAVFQVAWRGDDGRGSLLSPPAFVRLMGGPENGAPAKNVKPRITVVTVSYNQSDFLEASIKSVLDQDYDNLEYIVVDGGSTDGSVEIIERYQSRLAKVIIEPDEGQSDALNKGFALATGDVMNWLCSDDMLELGSLERIASCYASTSADLIVGGCVRIGQTRDQEILRHHTAIPCGGLTPFSFLDVLSFMTSWQRGNYFYQPEVFFSRRVWEASGAHISRHLYYMMDYELWLRMAAAGATVYHVPQILGCSRMHDAQKTQNDQLYLHQAKQIMEEYLILMKGLKNAPIFGKMA